MGSRFGNNSSASLLIPKAVFTSVLESDHLCICHLNVQSLTARNFTKFNELSMIFRDSLMDVICMSETWLDDSINDSMINIRGYKLIRNDRDRRGGGVCVYVRNNLVARILKTSNNNNSSPHSKTEYLCLEIECQGERFFLGVYYNPPEVDCSMLLFEHFEDYTVRYDSTFFVGDFNTDLRKTNNRQRRFSDLLSSLSLQCINIEPTFYHHFGCLLLNVVITDNTDLVVKHDQASMPGVSNHDMLFFNLWAS